MSQLHPTTGEKKVGWYFIASGNDVADGIKTQCAALIDLISNYIELNPEEMQKATDYFVAGCEASQELLKSLNPKK